MNGYPKTYARDDIPKIERYPGGQTTPTPKSIDFRPGELLRSVSGELGLRKFLESQRHMFVVTSDKDRPKSVFEKELADADIVISQPFLPAYLTAERIGKAPRLKLAVAAGIGSDHVDLQAAMDRGITVAEVTYCKPGAYIVNTVRGKICDRDAVVRALKSGQLAGYAGDVWFPMPAPRDHRVPLVPRSPRRHDTRQACARSSNAGLRVGRSAMNTSSWTPGSSLEPAHTPAAPAMRRAVPRRLRDSRQRQAGVTLRASRPSIKSLLGRRPNQCRHRQKSCANPEV
ncbi:MAG: NAD(P)-dependent oxidoreductase [Steroidobacteraceae bacterium]